jgi:peptidase E
VSEHIVAMGGGGFSAGVQDAALDLFALGLAESSRPRICLLPTAGGDAEEQIGRFHAFFSARECEPSHVALFRRGEADVDLRELLLGQDVIYVGGGSLLNLLAIWRVHEIDSILRDAWEAGIVLCGLSAGSMCWFEGGVTTSTGAPRVAPGLGFLRGSNSVHWSSQPARREVYRAAIASGELGPGYGVDDGAALVFQGPRLVEVISAREGAGARRVERSGDGFEEHELAVRRLAPAPPARDRTPLAVTELREVRELRGRYLGPRG